MLITRLCQAPLLRVTLNKPHLLQNSAKFIVRRSFRDSRDSVGQEARRQTLREKIMAPAGPNAFGVGQGVVAGGAVVGLGALMFYGLGLSNKPGAIDQARFWPPIVKQRIRDTYMYFGASIAASVASAYAVFNNPTLLKLVTRNGWMSLIVVFGLMIGTGSLAQSIEYKPGFGVKQMAWLLHTSVMGAVLAPMVFLGGPILIRAGWYTAGVVGGLSMIAVSAPSDKFLNIGAPLAMGLGVVFAASIANMFLPPSTKLGAGLYSLSIYGGLVLFSLFLLYDTQRIVKMAETWPTGYGVQLYDPVAAGTSIYMDTLNIFIRIAMIMAGGGGRSNRK